MIVQLATDVLPHVSKLTLILTGTADEVTLVMLPDKKDKGIAINPINMKGSAAEVEAELQNAISKIFAENKGLFSNIDEVNKDLKEKAANYKAASSTGKGKAKQAPAGKTEDDDDDDNDTTEETKEEPVKLTAAQLKVEKDQKKNFERAEKSIDLDVVAFVEKEVIKAYTAAKMPDKVMSNLTEKFKEIRESKGKPKETVVPATEGMFATSAEPVKEKEPVAEVAAEPVAEKAVEPVVVATPPPPPPPPPPVEEEEIIF